MQTFEEGQKVWFKGGGIHGIERQYEPQIVICSRYDKGCHYVVFQDGEGWLVSDDQLSEIPEDEL